MSPSIHSIKIHRMEHSLRPSSPHSNWHSAVSWHSGITYHSRCGYSHTYRHIAMVWRRSYCPSTIRIATISDVRSTFCIVITSKAKRFHGNSRQKIHYSHSICPQKSKNDHPRVGHETNELWNWRCNYVLQFGVVQSDRLCDAQTTSQMLVINHHTTSSTNISITTFIPI